MKINNLGFLLKTELRVCHRQLNEGESHKKKFLVKNKQYIKMQNFNLYFTLLGPLDLGLVWGVGLTLALGLDNIS